MPKGPRGEKRPADVIGAAVQVMKISTGEIAENVPPDQPRSAAAERMANRYPPRLLAAGSTAR